MDRVSRNSDGRTHVVLVLRHGHLLRGSGRRRAHGIVYVPAPTVPPTFRPVIGNHPVNTTVTLLHETSGRQKSMRNPTPTDASVSLKNSLTCGGPSRDSTRSR